MRCVMSLLMAALLVVVIGCGDRGYKDRELPPDYDTVSDPLDVTAGQMKQAAEGGAPNKK